MAERCVAILGPGLLGGSLALACQSRMPGAELRLWARRSEALESLPQHGVTAAPHALVEDCVRGASMVVLATPVTTMSDLAQRVALSELASDAIITDVGSVKGPLVRQLTPLFEGLGGPAFIGSHPMAGSEKTGIEAARTDLFDGAVCVVTPTTASNPDTTNRVSNFWSVLGARVLNLTPDQHDEHVARISHLPHLMAAMTTLAALDEHPQAADCIGSGFRDSTRIAAGDPDLWTGIVQQNRDAVLASLRDASKRLTACVEIIETLNDEQLRQMLADAKRLRDSVSAPPPNHGHPQS